MTINRLVALLVLFSTDLKSEAAEKEFVTIKDFTPEAQTASEDADVVIYEDQAKKRQILVYNNDMDTQGVPSFEIVDEDSIQTERVGAEAWREEQA